MMQSSDDLDHQQQQDDQQVVIMTNIAQGHVANSKDLEAQAQAQEEIEATNTTVKSDHDNNNNDALLTNNTDTSQTSLSKRKTLKERLLTSHHNQSSDSNTTTSTTATATPPTIRIPPATKAPKETLKAVYAAGKYKAGLTLNVLMVQSFMAGVYIAAAGHLYLAVGGGILGSALFPAGLIAVILTSAELFTGDALIFVASVLGRQVPFHRLVRNWTVAWCSNFAGCLAWAFFLSYLSDALVDSHADELAVKVAEKKALNSMLSIFLKSIGANFMVCVAVWQGTCAEEVAGKVLALWFPTAAFVMMGFDHVVANMFLIPVGMMLGADVSVGELLSALAMATLGNAIGGGIFVGAVYWYVFDSMSSFGGLTARIRHNMRSLNVAGRLQHASSAVGPGSHHKNIHNNNKPKPSPPSSEFGV